MAQTRYDYSTKILLTTGSNVIEQLHQFLVQHLHQMDPAKTGIALISERYAAEKLGINRSAVHKVYELLRADGLLYRRSNSKNYIISNFHNTDIGQNVGIILPGSLREYWRELHYREMRQELFCGICDRAFRKGLGVRVVNLPSPNCRKSEYENFLLTTVPSLLGIIHLGDRGIEKDPVLEQLLTNEAIPQVLVLSRSKHNSCGYVSFDIRGGIQAVAQHLLDLGHRKLALFYSVFKKYPVYYPLMRPEEIFRAFQNTWLDVRPEWTFAISSENEQQEIDSALDRLLAMPNKPSAIWCRNDWYAIMVMEKLRNKGIRVPEDFSVIGTDDLGSAENAKLTSLCLPFYNVGNQAVEMLLRIRRERDAFQQRSLLLTPSLTIRNSSSSLSDLKASSARKIIKA